MPSHSTHFRQPFLLKVGVLSGLDSNLSPYNFPQTGREFQWIWQHFWSHFRACMMKVSSACKNNPQSHLYTVWAMTIWHLCVIPHMYGCLCVHVWILWMDMAWVNDAPFRCENLPCKWHKPPWPLAENWDVHFCLAWIWTLLIAWNHMNYMGYTLHVVH